MHMLAGDTGQVVIQCSPVCCHGAAVRSCNDIMHAGLASACRSVLKAGLNPREEGVGMHNEHSPLLGAEHLQMPSGLATACRTLIMRLVL